MSFKVDDKLYTFFSSNAASIHFSEKKEFGFLKNKQTSIRKIRNFQLE